MRKMFLNMATAQERWNDLNVHELHAQTEAKAGLSRSMQRDLPCTFLFLPRAICKTKVEGAR